MNKKVVDVTFTLMTDRRGINIQGERTIVSTYKQCIQLYVMKIVRLLIPESLTKSQKGGNLIKEKSVVNKREGCARMVDYKYATYPKRKHHEQTYRCKHNFIA